MKHYETYYIFCFSYSCLRHYVGCSENEIDLYDQTPRINFYGSTTHVRTLVDTDYVKKEPYAVDSFEVRIQGEFFERES